MIVNKKIFMYLKIIGYGVDFKFVFIFNSRFKRNFGFGLLGWLSGLFLLFLGVFVGIFEEFFFRGVVVDWREGGRRGGFC